MRVDRKGEVSAGGPETPGSGGAAESVKGGKPVPFTDDVAKAGSHQFVERLVTTILADVRGGLESLQSKVDAAAAQLVSQPNQVTVDAYKESVSQLLAFIISNSVKIEQAQSLKKGNDGKPKKIYTRVITVNDKLAELGAAMLNTQKPVLDLVNRLDEIRGLVVDLYDWKDTR